MTGRRLLLAGLLLLPTVLVFAPGLSYPFVALDDVYHVVENPGIRDLSLGGLHFLFFEDTRDLRYFPVSYLSFAIDYQLFGLDPFHFHLTNLILHCANTLLVAAFVGRIFRDPALGFWTALLFSIHPLQVESVAWVMSRKNVLFLFFFLLSALGYVEAMARRQEGLRGTGGMLFASALLYFVACLAKTAALPLPLALCVVDLASGRDARRSPLRRLLGTLPSKLPYLLPFAAVVVSSLLYSAPNPFRTDFGFSPLEWLVIVGHNFFFYVEKTLLPAGLAPFYPLPAAGSLPAHFVLYAILAAGLCVLAFLCLLRNWSVAFFGLAWYLVTIAPNTVYAMFFSDLPILSADRYYYQSAIGLLAMPAAASLAIWRHSTRWRPALAAAVAMTLAALCSISIEHRSHWRSTTALYENVVNRHPNDDFFYRLALEYAAAGRKADAFHALDQAVTAPSQIFYLDFLFYRLQLARLQLERGDFPAAADQVEAGIASTPNAWEPSDARTPLAYLYLADLRDRAGQPEAAERAREAAARAAVDPEYAFEILFAGKMPEEARQFLERRIEADPNDAMAWFAYGIVAQVSGDERRANQRFERARRLGYRPASAGSGRGP